MDSLFYLWYTCKSIVIWTPYFSKNNKCWHPISKSWYIFLSQVISLQVKSSQVKSSQVKSSQVKSRHKSFLYKSSQVTSQVTFYKSRQVKQHVTRVSFKSWSLTRVKTSPVNYFSLYQIQRRIFWRKKLTHCFHQRWVFLHWFSTCRYQRIQHTSWHTKKEQVYGLFHQVGARFVMVSIVTSVIIILDYDS